MRSILLAAAASLIASAAFAAPIECPVGLRPATTAEVFFGQDPAVGAQVSEADWRAFLAAEIGPRFPNSLAASDVFGERRGADFVREPSRALFIVLANRPDDQRRLDLVRAAYNRQFHQDSVMLVEERACVSF